ncbi:MAG: hypothetical protein ACPGJV_13460, partial [Bacteriovoracaceae bacterium]
MNLKKGLSQFARKTPIFMLAFLSTQAVMAETMTHRDVDGPTTIAGDFQLSQEGIFKSAQGLDASEYGFMTIQGVTDFFAQSKKDVKIRELHYYIREHIDINRKSKNPKIGLRPI